MLLSLDGQCRPVSASSEDQSVLVGASLDQLLWVTLEWLAQSDSLQNILPEAVPAGFTGCSEQYQVNIVLKMRQACILDLTGIGEVS